MALQSLAHNSIFYPEFLAPSSTSMTSITGIAATGEKVAFMGYVETPDRGTKSIRKVHFLTGTVVKAGGSALTLSLQDMSTAANCVPDETQDETVAIGNASLASNTWITSGNLSADRSVAHGDPLAIVIEFDGAGRLGADSIGFSTKARATYGNGASSLPTFKLKTAGSWTRPSNGYGSLSILFEFSDGTYGTFMGCTPVSAAGTQAFNSGSAPPIYALRWNQPFKCKLDGVMFALGVASTSASTVDLVLYTGTTATVTKTINPRFHGTTSVEPIYVPFTETQLEANTDYYLAVKPTSANNVTIAYVDVAAAGYMAAMPGGANFCLSTLSAGTWANTTTRRPEIYPQVSAVDDGAGSGVPVGFGSPLFRGGIVL